jgi:hypothetical protein
MGGSSLKLFVPRHGYPACVSDQLLRRQSKWILPIVVAHGGFLAICPGACTNSSTDLDIGENLIISSAIDYYTGSLEATRFHAGQKSKNFIRLNVLPISTSSRYRTAGARRRKRCNT